MEKAPLLLNKVPVHSRTATHFAPLYASSDVPAPRLRHARPGKSNCRKPKATVGLRCGLPAACAILSARALHVRNILCLQVIDLVCVGVGGGWALNPGPKVASGTSRGQNIPTPCRAFQGPADPDCRVEPKNMIGSRTPSEALGIIPVSSGDEYDLRHSVFCPLVARTYRQIGKYASPFSELRHNDADRGLDAHRDMGMERLGSRTAYTLHCHIVVPCDGGLEARLVVGEQLSSAHERSGRTGPVDMKPQGKLTTYMVKPGHLQLAAGFQSSLSPRRASPGVVGHSVALFACSHRLSAISHMMELGPRKGE